MNHIMDMAALMNRVKLQFPKIESERVQRPHLLARLDEVIQKQHGIALLIAPTGFGKTTLAADWAASQTAPVAWLSLDVEDNDVMTFLLYMTEAIRGVEEEMGQEALQMIQSPQPPSYLIVLKALLHDLKKRSGSPLCVVLDDYQAISANPVREVINYLIESMPPAFRLIILSKIDPPMAVPRLRVEGRLVEIRTADLRFTAEEAELFLSDYMGLSLSADEIATLNQRIEGWPAGLQMAGLAMQVGQDVDFIHRFSGSKSYILDYLADAVLDRQEKGVQNFLLKTSVLSRVSASLASAMLLTRPIGGFEDVTVDADSAYCQQLLDHLYRSKMFVTPLDEEHAWFQYHPLFAELLRTKLHIIDHAAFKDLHLRACDWYQQCENMVGAVNHALMAEETEKALSLFERHALTLLAEGNMAALGRWVGMLVEDEVRSRPWLCISQAWVMAYAGRLSGLEGLLAHADLQSKQIASEEERQSIFGHIAAIRSFLSVLTGDMATAVRWNKKAAKSLPKGDYWVSGMQYWITGTIARVQGKLDQSAGSFEEVMRSGQVIGNMWSVITAATEMALVRYIQGDLNAARRTLEDAMTMAYQQGVENYSCMSRLQTALANIDYEQGKLEAAFRLIEMSIDSNRFWKNPNHLIYAYATCAHIQLSSGDGTGAANTLEQADQEMRGLPVMSSVIALLDSARIRLWISKNHSTAANDWLARNEISSMVNKGKRKLSNTYQEDVELNQTTAVRVLLYQDRVDDAFTLLDRLMPAASAGGRTRAIIQFTILYAIAKEMSGQTESALHWLDQALELAQKPGFVQMFVDEGQPMERLLKLVAGSERMGSAYAGRILPVFSAPKPVVRVRSIPKPVRVEQKMIIGTLSNREKEVLNLIAAGLTNQQIGLRLVISTGTVKAHSANIYRKLAAGNRVQAVERARALKLLS
jgi:LuxR family transcriptional regulator, maltose regulon positive regulatory protein